MLGGWEWLILLVVVLLLFGTKRLPEMARSIGQSARVFKGEMKGMKSDDEPRGRAEEPRSPDRAALPPGESSARPPAGSPEQHPDSHPDGTR